MKRVVFLFLFFICGIMSIYTQNISKFLLKISASKISDTRVYNFPFVDDQHPGGSWEDKNSVPHFRIETIYLINQKIELGLYAGLSKLNVPFNQNDIYDTMSTSTNGYFIGTEMNYHILPLLIKRATRFDIYGTTKIGVVSKKWNGHTGYPTNKDNVLEVGAGIGAAYYFTYNFGVYGEVLGGKFYYSNTNWRAGLCLKL